MGIPQVRESSTALAAEIEKQLSNSTVAQYDILNRSQAKMADLESETQGLVAKKAEADNAVRRNRENVRRLMNLIERDEALSNDLDVSIQANLQAIHTLRERGVQPPAPIQTETERG